MRGGNAVPAGKLGLIKWHAADTRPDPMEEPVPGFIEGSFSA